MLELAYKFLDQNILIFMSMQLAFLLLFLALNFKTIARHFLKIDRRTWTILLMIFLLGFFLMNAEYWYGYHSDAYAPLETAKFLVLEGKNVKACAAGRAGYCSSYQQVLQPVGFPYLISLLYMIFGINTLPVLVFSGVLSSLTTILVFLICYLLFKKEELGLYASLVYALIPLNIFFSGTGFTRIISLFFVGCTVLIYLISIRKNNLRLWILFALFFSFSIYIRQENYVLIPLFLLGLFLFSYNLKNKDNMKKLFIAAVVFIVFQLHVFYWTFFIISQAFTHPLGLPTYSLGCLFRMSPYIFSFMLGLFPYIIPSPYILAATLLFIMGIAIIPVSFLMKKDHTREALFTAVWFILFFVIYGAYCMNFIDGLSQDPDTSFVRYIIQFHIPYAILAGYAFYMITRLGKKISRYATFILVPIFVILLLMPVQPPTTMFKDARTDHDSEYFSAIRKTPPNSTIITQMFMLVSSDVVGGNRKYIDPEVMVLHGTPEHTVKLLHESKDVYYIELDYCKHLPDYSPCKFIRENLDLEFAFREGSLNVYKVLVKPDKDYSIEWDNSFLYDVKVRSNEIMNITTRELQR